MGKIRAGSNEEVFEGETLKYFCKESENDRRKIILIFSGFRPAGTLDFFGNSIKPIRNEVIWLHDSFGMNGTESYYLFSNGQNGPECSVTSFIDALAQERGIDRKDIISAGFSKGGSAALYYAYKLGLGGCITSVPQFAIGSYMKNHWVKKFQDYSGGQAGFIDMADQYIRKCIEDSNFNPPVYLITSFADDQYETEIKPNLKLLSSKDNFNLIVTDSPLVGRHVEVTPYNVPTIQSLFLMLSEGIFPEIGVVHNGSTAEAPANYEISENTPFEAYLDEISINGGRLQLVYDSILRGVTSDKHGLTDRKILIGKSLEVLAGSIFSEENTKKYYRSKLVDYSFTKTRVLEPQGVLLDNLKEGTHQIIAQTRKRGADSDTAWLETPIVSRSEITKLIFWKDNYFWIKGSPNGVFISRFRIENMLMPKIDEVWNTVNKLAVDEDTNTLEIQGRLLPHGVTAERWGEVYYQLLLQNNKLDNHVVALGQLERPLENYPATINKSFYSNLYAQPVRLDGLSEGTWEIRVVGHNAQVAFTSGIIATLHIDNGSIFLQRNNFIN